MGWEEKIVNLLRHQEISIKKIDELSNLFAFDPNWKGFP